MKLLFITSNRLGDAVISTGLLNHLVTTRDAQTTVASGPVAAALFSCLPGLERVIPIRKNPRAGHWRHLWKETFATRWDLIVDLRASPMTFILRARERRTMYKAGEGNRVESLARWFGCKDVPNPTIWSDDAHRAEAEELLPPGGKILCLAPTANWQGKIWPAERFVELAHRLTGPSGPLAGARIAVSGGRGEEALAAPVLQAFPADRRIDLVGRGDMLSGAEQLRRCDFVVSNDSGLMHLSAAVGTPTLGLFGPSPVENYAPWGARAAAVTTEIAYDDLFGPDYDRHTTGSLMTSLSVDAAENAANALLEKLS